MTRLALTMLLSASFLASCDDGASYSTASPSSAPTAGNAASPTAAGEPAGSPAKGAGGARQSSSVLGKARDRALDVRDQMEARDREIQKQIDDLHP
jgi:hypothetical protein